MKKTFGTLLAAAVLSGTIGANVQAEEVTVKKGDSLWKLATVHKTTVDELKEWNSLSSELIFAGDTLTINPDVFHEVVLGDSLWKIAKAYNVKVENLIDWNQLKSETIHPGMELVIHQENVNKSSVLKPSVQKPAVSSAVPVKTPAATPAAAPAKKTVGASTKTASTKDIVVTATAYTASCAGCSGITATGINLKENPGLKVISVDPSVIPLGSKVYVEGYGEAIAGDTGGSIKGNKIDVFISSKDKAIQWGVKTVKVTILQ